MLKASCYFPVIVLWFPLFLLGRTCSAGNDHENRSSLEFYTGIYGLEKLRIKEIFNQVKERQIDHGRIGKRFYAMTLNVTEPDIHDFGKLSQEQETLQLSVLVSYSSLVMD